MTWALACLAAPVAHVASGLPWQTVLGISLLGTVLRIWIGRWIQTPESRTVYAIVSVLTLGQALGMMENCWPKQRDMGWVMLLLLILAAIQAGKGKEAAVQGGLLLWWLTALLLGSVLVSAIPEIKPAKLLRWQREISWTEMGELLILLLIPAALKLDQASGKTEPRLLLLPVLCALCTQGVLGLHGAGESRAPFYELSRTVSFYGLLERMEALAWLGLMLGTYLYMTFLLTLASEGTPDKKSRIFLLAVSLAAAKGAERYLDGKVLEILILTGVAIAWMLSAGQNLTEKIKERKMKKYEKNG